MQQKGKGEVASQVELQDTALEVGSGSLRVFATPCMVAMMEGAACEALEVRAEAELIQVEGRKLTFQVRAFDEKGEIGSGTHERVLISEQKFLDKTYEKL